jgi:hypothetical protein
MLKFSGLLKAVGLSELERRKLSIKLKIDSSPPQGWKAANTIVNKAYLLNIVHFDLPSSFATKLHACFYRKYTKGRDLYDFIWYISRKVSPNFLLLNNAIEQARGSNPGINEENFKEFLFGGLKKIDFNAAKKDVERFLEDKTELRLLELKPISETINSTY